jgi:hypothetical protein
LIGIGFWRITRRIRKEGGLMFDWVAKLIEPLKDTRENELTLGFGKGESGKEIDQLKGLGERRGDKHDNLGGGWF